jgi:hypothetical protein
VRACIEVTPFAVSVTGGAEPASLASMARVTGPVDIGAAAGQLPRVDDAARVVIGPELATHRGALRCGRQVGA